MLGAPLVSELFRAGGGIVPMDALRERERDFHRIAIGTHGVLDGGRCAVHLHDTGDGRVLPAPVSIDVVEHFFAAVMLHVDVDVRRFRLAIHADVREKALE